MFYHLHFFWYNHWNEEIRFSFDSINFIFLSLFRYDIEYSVSFTGSLGLFYYCFLVYIIIPLFQSAMMLFARACQLIINVTRHVSIYNLSADEIHKKTAWIWITEDVFIKKNNMANYLKNSTITNRTFDWVIFFIRSDQWASSIKHRFRIPTDTVIYLSFACQSMNWITFLTIANVLLINITNWDCGLGLGEWLLLCGFCSIPKIHVGPLFIMIFFTPIFFFSRI